SSAASDVYKRQGWNIVNGGVSADTSAQALSRLPALLARKPKLGIVGIGANDFLRKVPEEQTRANSAKIIETVQKKNIPAVLV
ncbi:arylesterase, partial [Neisseria meningitidis]|uniref:GDSL-type esterase/lipase family protein n=1 Tax=Neisseria meningitidis TaxID=487 RepID=UPI000CB6EF3C